MHNNPPYKLALVSTNRSKYSETFIHRHVKGLNGDLLYLTDGYFPSKYSIGWDGVVHAFPGKWYDRWTSSQTDHHNLTGLKRIMREHGSQIVLAEYGASGVAMMPICRELNLPLIVHFHGYDAYRKEVLEGVGRQYSSLFAQASAIIVVSDDMKRNLVSLGAPEGKLFKNTYGIDTSFFKPAESGNQKTQLLFVGRFVDKKAPFHLLLAFRDALVRKPHLSLVMIGDGPLRISIEMLVRDLGMEKIVVFKGVQSPEEVRDAMQMATIFIQHSLVPSSGDSEGTPVSILEAMASGLPVISTRHAGIPEVVQDGVSGILVDEGDIQGMAEAIVQLEESDTLKEQMGRAGRKIILNHYTHSLHLQRLEDIIENTLSLPHIPKKN